MAVAEPDYASAPRGRTDASRHRRKVKEAIRKNLPDIIGNESIITRKGEQVVKVPIRGVRSYQFIHGRPGGAGGGFGSGESKKGTVVGRRPKPGRGGGGRPGGEPGVDYIETEVDIEELIQMMLEDLQLPNLQRKDVRQTVVSREWTIEGVEPSGIIPRLDKKRSVKEAIKRTEVLIGTLMEETGRSEEECRRALARTQGDAADALALLRSRTPLWDEAESPEVTLDSSDLRFRTIEEDTKEESNAVILAMMDVSGSMGEVKKYFARSFYFWMLSFLRTMYQHVEVRFIAHTTEAKLVDETEFFHRGESGGTNCASAYELAADLVDTEYPTSRWNVYPFHFSDGEDWDPAKSAKAVEALLERGVAALGYGEIQTEYSYSVLMHALAHQLSLRVADDGDFAYYYGEWGQTPVIGVVLRSKSDLYPSLRAFLGRERRRLGV